jgi:hypothetical protein
MISGTRRDLGRVAGEVMRHAKQTRGLETRFQLLTAALLLLAVVAVAMLIWLKRRVENEFGELRSQLAAAFQEAEQAQTKSFDQYVARVTKLEKDVSDVAGRVSRTGTQSDRGAYRPAPTPQPPPLPPDHWPEIHAASNRMRALLNEQKASPEEYANIIGRFPERWVITTHGLEEFSTDNQRDHEIVLFGYSDAMAALPAQFAVLRLSGSYSDPSRAERWFHNWFDISSLSGRPFEIVRAAEAVIQDGKPEMMKKGAITLRS